MAAARVGVHLIAPVGVGGVGLDILGGALQVLVLMLEADDSAFQAAAVRWIARFTSQCAGVTLGEAYAALEALDALPAT